MKKILIVEDERSIADTVVHSVEREGYLAEWRMRGQEALDLLRQGEYALVVLDVGLPDISGFELCKSIRTFSQVPVIFLTARDDEIDRIVGLEIGADDYVTKPFSPRELGARIKTVLRRSAQAGATIFAGQSVSAAGETAACRLLGGKLKIDEEKMQALFLGQRLELTRYEFRLLALLAACPGRVYSREALMQQVWGDDSPSLDRTVDAHVKSLRGKFRELDDSAEPILTHRGSGYALKDDS